MRGAERGCAVSESKHTPGPWRIDLENYSCGQVRADCLACSCDGELRGYYQTIATVTQRDAHPVFGGGIPRATMEANARLIAAAPELLALLAEATKGCTQAEFRDWEIRANALIAKVEGRV